MILHTVAVTLIAGLCFVILAAIIELLLGAGTGGRRSATPLPPQIGGQMSRYENARSALDEADETLRAAEARARAEGLLS